MTRRSIIGPVTFLLVAFGIPWSGWLLVHDERLSLWLFPMFASFAGFAASFAAGGTKGLREFSARVFTIRRTLLYVTAAVLIPVSLGLSYLLAMGMSLSSIVLSTEALLGLSLGAALVTGPL